MKYEKLTPELVTQYFMELIKDHELDETPAAEMIIAALLSEIKDLQDKVDMLETKVYSKVVLPEDIKILMPK